MVELCYQTSQILLEAVVGRYGEVVFQIAQNYWHVTIAKTSCMNGILLSGKLTIPSKGVSNIIDVFLQE